MALRYDPVTRQMVEDAYDIPQLAPGLIPPPRPQPAPVRGVPVAGHADALREAGVRLLGGDTNAPGYDPTPASRAVASQADSATNFVRRLSGAALGEAQPVLQAARGGLLSALGAQPAPPAQPTVPQTQTPALVAAQPEAQNPYSPEVLGAWAGPERTAQGTAPAEAPRYGAYNTALGSTMQPAQRGLYTMQNTDQAALAQRAAPTNGITFGFGGGNETAQEYLARMRQQDQEDALANNAALLQRRALDAQERIGNAKTLQELVAARSEAALLAPLAQQAQAGLASGVTANTTGRYNLAQQAMQSQAALLGSQATAQATLEAAGARSAGDLQKVQLQGQMNAQLELLKAQAKSATPEGQVAAMKVQQVEAYLQRAMDPDRSKADREADLVEANALLGSGRPAQAQYEQVTDMYGNPVGGFNSRQGTYLISDDETLRAAQRATNIRRGAQ